MSVEPPHDDPADDTSISDELEVLRRVPPGEFKSTGVPNSNNFDLDPDGGGTSVVLSIDEVADLARVSEGHEEYGVVALRVSAWRSHGLRIVRRPLDGNPNHCEIFGDRSTSAKRKLAKQCRWIRYPADFPDELKIAD